MIAIVSMCALAFSACTRGGQNEAGSDRGNAIVHGASSEGGSTSQGGTSSTTEHGTGDKGGSTTEGKTSSATEHGSKGSSTTEHEGASGDHAAAAESGAEAAHAPIKVPIATVQSSDVPIEVVIPGVVAALPDHSVKVTPMAAGKLSAVFVVPGQAVHKGQVIAKLDDRHVKDQLAQSRASIETAQANLMQSENNLTFARDSLERQKKLFAAEVSAQKDVIVAQNQLRTAEAQVEAGKSQVKAAEASRDQILVELGFTEIHCPISGIVANRYLNVGDTADLSSAIAQVVGLDTVLTNAALPADSPDRVNVGQHAAIKPVAHPDIKFDGTVGAISPVIDPQTNTIRIQLRCKNRGGELREGQNVTVSITRKVDRSAILIPKTALVPDPDHPEQQMVYTVHDGKAHRVPVRVGTERGERIEIVSGLHKGDEIVTDKGYGLPDDTAVVPEGK